MSDSAKKATHAAFNTIDAYLETYKRLPGTWNVEDAQ
jgi:Ubiquitin-activating enzyme E1 four-helix bundle